MKINTKLKFLFLSLCVLTLTFGPSLVFAQEEELKADGEHCTNPGHADASCENGFCTTGEQCSSFPCSGTQHWDDNLGKCVANACDENAQTENECQASNGQWEWDSSGTSGSCSCSSTNPGSSGQTCATLQCTYGCNTVNNTCNPPPGGGNPGGGNPSGGSGSSGQCGGDPNLVYVNGVCLPKNQQCSDGSFRCVSSLSGLLVKIIKTLLFYAGILAVLMLMIGGYWYMAAGGNEEQAEKGKKTVINFVLGLVIILMAYAIVTIISNTLTS